MTIPTCQFEVVGKFCVCGECGTIWPVSAVRGGGCDNLKSWCKASPEYKAEMSRLAAMTPEQRKLFLAERATSQMTAEPGMIAKAWNYSEAVARWKLAGSPTRSQQEIDAILEICRACPFYTNNGRPRCKKCGCSVNNQPNGIANKIAMATESCPLDPPKWSATE